jgi:tetratricopeptide (TPR) repeat protein
MRFAPVTALLAALAASGAAAQDNPAHAPVPAPQTAPRDFPGDQNANRKDMEGINAQIVQARKANADKRYADAEALMQPLTRQHPALVLPWIELGTAEMNLKKYPEAEFAFKRALGIDPASLQEAHKDDFFVKVDAPGVVASGATRSSRNTVGGTVIANAESRTPEIQGVGWASLGEVYAHEHRIGDAEAAFDSAVRALPASAAVYRRNQTISFFQAGDSEAQLKAANQAIALDPARSSNYYFKGQALVGKATMDGAKMVLPPGCAEAYQKYLELDPNGPYSADAKGVLTAAGLPLKSSKK